MTQKEIAGTLGISQSTVSLALAGSEKIGAHIRAQVQALAKESGYSRNLNAIALQGRKSKLVGIIFPDFSEDYYNELKKDIHALLKDRGYTGLFFTTGYDGDIDGILDELQGRGVEGVITGPRTTPRLKKLCLDGLPAVFYRKPPAIPCSSVDVDRYEGGYMAGRHLLSLGRGSFVILGGADPSDPARAFKGFLAALAEAGVEMPESAMLPCRTEWPRL
jgi:DNA-binding LacI/PurR family transcriptional regulator